jgi:hypothetical protein
MTRWTEEDLRRALRKRLPSIVSEEKKPSKYRNVKMRVDGIVWDSKHEADRYVALKAKQEAGEISELRWKIRFPLITVRRLDPTLEFIVADYIADFVYLESGVRVVEDTKGKLTPMYRLKRKWLELQEHIVIREIYRPA